MKIARGNTRKLLQSFGEIQDLSGKAIGIYNNDRSPDRSCIIPVLERIFNIALDARSDYKPVNYKAKEVK